MENSAAANEWTKIRSGHWIGLDSNSDVRIQLGSPSMLIFRVYVFIKKTDKHGY